MLFSRFNNHMSNFLQEKFNFLKGIEKRIENHFSHREFHDGTCGEKVHAKLYPFKSFKNSKDEQTDGQVYKAVFFLSLCERVFERFCC